MTMIIMVLVTNVNAAVSLNQKGIGQVLIFPYYTVNNDINTLMSITNTTDKVKALKIRFLEGKNNRDTLIFNIYLGPHDVWTGALVSTTSTIQGHEGEDSVKLITNDESCTVPVNITGQEFLPFGLEGEFADGISTNMSRVTEGHIQVFEMGNVVADFAAFASPGHDNFNCHELQNSWTPPSGAWTLDATQDLVAPDGSGGLFGSVSLIDVAGGFDVAYNADAIQGYSTEIQHQHPADSAPNLNSGSSSESVYTSNFLTTIIPWNHPFQAISSLFMMDAIFGEFAINGGIGANTEWVTSFPTKSYHVDPLFAPETVPIAPFTVALDTTGDCETAQIQLYNRETGVNTAGQDSIDLCWGTNIFEFTKELNDNEASILLGSRNTTAISTPSDTGWLNLKFSQRVNTTDESQNTVRAIAIDGLPMTGFAMQRYVNGNLDGGILANYAGLFIHKGSSKISIVSPAQ